MSSSSDPQARKALTFDTGDGNDWGVSWPGIEDAITGPLRSEEGSLRL